MACFAVPPSTFRTPGCSLQTRAFPNTIARARFPGPSEVRRRTCVIRDLTGPPFLPQGGRTRWAPLPGGLMTCLGPSALGLWVQTLVRAWRSARGGCWASGSVVARTGELALPCPSLRAPASRLGSWDGKIRLWRGRHARNPRLFQLGKINF